MSGGGGGDDTWRKIADPSPGQPPNPCDIDELTMLNSPDRSVLSSLSAGMLLNVEYEAGPPRRLIARAPAGVAGSITSISLPQLIQCIQANNKYVAEILTLRGAVCQVRVRRA